MAKAIRSFPVSEQKAVINRRFESKSLGMGYWASVDAQRNALRNALIVKGLIKPLDK
jgi:hypothetical protein